MKTQILFVLAFCCLTSLGQAAEPMPVADLVALAVKDPKNAPLIIEYGVEDNPTLVLQIVEAVVKAMPGQAVAIVGAVIKAVPKRQAEQQTEQQKDQQTQKQMDILRAAIVAQPTLATQFTQMTLELFPAKAVAILRTALESVPEAKRAEITELGKKLAQSPEQKSEAKPIVKTIFPVQDLPIDRPSPSS